MSLLDPQLLFLKDGGEVELPHEGSESVVTDMSLSMTASAGDESEKLLVNILVQFSDDLEILKHAGMQITSSAGDVIAGYISVDKLPALELVEGIERVEASRPLHAELDLSVVEARANEVHAGPPGRRGAGVIVGIVDTGCDFTHPCFRAADGSTRILSIWDQTLVPQAGESSPSGFTYGVEYTKSEIDAALLTAVPSSGVRHLGGRHGTHVAGIAAGDGSVAGQGRPANTFVGVAPEADLIIVSVRGNGVEGFGTSASALDAVNYVYGRAGSLDKPAVVNMSLGDNLGPHDGTSLLERGLDNLLGDQGRAFVKSAGNAGSARIHAQGNTLPSSSQTVRFNQPASSRTVNQMDCWYDGNDKFRVSVTDPSGNIVGPAIVGTVSNFTFPGGNTVRIDHRDNDTFNGDKRVFLTFSGGSASRLSVGQWELHFEALSAPSGGRFDVWIQRSRAPIPQFLSPHENRAMTLSTPGTAHEIITAANYSARGFSAGSLASSSSRGPTRDGRAAPTLAAPGTDVVSARAQSGGDAYESNSGTSMSAPHITGAIALMFQKNRNQTQAQIKACLERSARSDANTGPTPNTAWGAGKLDAKAAVDCVRGVPAIRPSVVQIQCRRSVIQPECLVSVPRNWCNIQPSVLQIQCPSVIPVTCVQSVVTVCQSVPIQNCNIQSVPGTICNIQSVVDGCPSVPRGCFNSGTGRPFSGDKVDDNGQLVGFQPFEYTEGSAQQHQSRDNPEESLPIPTTEDGAGSDSLWQDIDLPEEGYFEYDDAWFDTED